jgi:hypothetical protein
MVFEAVFAPLSASESSPTHHINVNVCLIYIYDIRRTIQSFKKLRFFVLEILLHDAQFTALVFRLVGDMAIHNVLRCTPTRYAVERCSS